MSQAPLYGSGGGGVVVSGTTRTTLATPGLIRRLDSERSGSILKPIGRKAGSPAAGLEDVEAPLPHRYLLARFSGLSWHPGHDQSER